MLKWQETCVLPVCKSKIVFDYFTMKQLKQYTKDQTSCLQIKVRMCKMVMLGKHYHQPQKKQEQKDLDTTRHRQTIQVFCVGLVDFKTVYAKKQTNFKVCCNILHHTQVCTKVVVVVCLVEKSLMWMQRQQQRLSRYCKELYTTKLVFSDCKNSLAFQ